MVNLTRWKRKNNAPDQGNNMQHSLERLFDEPFLPAFYPFDRSEWWPRIDVSEGRNSITVEAEIPGMDKKDIDLSIENGRYLHINGRKSNENKENKKGYYRVERSYGYFSRTLELPAAVDDTKIDAKYRRGVLKIKLNKQKSKQPHAIKISSTA